jgi:hypothetical protein
MTSLSTIHGGTEPFVSTFRTSWMHRPARASCPHVRRFCAQLHPTNEPTFVPVRPELLYGDGPYPMGRCYDGVEEYREWAGGTYQHGWMIWETEGIYLRAFHHCVHRDGRLLTDVSPQPHHRILFLPTAEPGEPDEAFEESGREGESGGVRCRYYPLSDSPEVPRIARLHEAKERHERYSPEWIGLLDEGYALEVALHERAVATSSHARRPKLTKRVLRRLR